MSLLLPYIIAALYAAKGYSPDGQTFDRFSRLWWGKHLSSKIPVGLYTMVALALLRPDVHYAFAIAAGLGCIGIWYAFQKRVYLSQLIGGRWADIDPTRFLLRKASELADTQENVVRVHGAFVGFIYALIFLPYLGVLAPMLLLKGFVWQWAKTDHHASLIYGGMMGLAVMG